MMRIKEEKDGALTLEASGQLTKQDYLDVMPQIEQLVKEHGKLRALVQLNEFEGWSPLGLVEELRFDVRHRNDIEKLAVLGEGTAQQVMTHIAKPIFSGDVCFFPKEEIREAKNWLASA